MGTKPVVEKGKPILIGAFISGSPLLSRFPFLKSMSAS